MFDAQLLEPTHTYSCATKWTLNVAQEYLLCCECCAKACDRCVWLLGAWVLGVFSMPPRTEKRHQFFRKLKSTHPSCYRNWLLTDSLHSDFQRSHWQLAFRRCHSDVTSRNVSCGDGEWIPLVSEIREVIVCGVARPSIGLIKSKLSSQTHMSAWIMCTITGTLILPDSSPHT